MKNTWINCSKIGAITLDITMPHTHKQNQLHVFWFILYFYLMFCIVSIVIYALNIVVIYLQIVAMMNIIHKHFHWIEQWAKGSLNVRYFIFIPKMKYVPSKNEHLENQHNKFILNFNTWTKYLLITSFWVNFDFNLTINLMDYLTLRTDFQVIIILWRNFIENEIKWPIRRIVSVRIINHVHNIDCYCYWFVAKIQTKNFLFLFVSWLSINSLICQFFCFALQ